eukprot:PhM_4_TR16744/c1_g1_i13/m.79412
MELDATMFSSREKRNLSVGSSGAFVRLSPPRAPCRLPLGAVSASRLNLGALSMLGPLSRDLCDALAWITTPRVADIVRSSPDLVETKTSTSRHVSRYLLTEMRDTLVPQGVFSPCAVTDLSITVPLFKVEKAGGETSRLIGDCRALNSLLPRPGNMGLPSIDDVLRELLGCRVLHQLDAKSYFYQFPVHESLRAVLVSRVGDVRGKFSHFCWNVMAMGLKFAPLVAQRTSWHVCEYVSRQAGGVTMPWVDNFLFGASSAEEMTSQLEHFGWACRAINMDVKAVDAVPGATMEAVGLSLDVSHSDVWEHFATVSPTFRQHLLDIDIVAVTTPRQLFGVFGSLMWGNYAILRRPLSAYHRTLQAVRETAKRVVGHEARWDAAADISDETRAELRAFVAEVASARVTLRDLRRRPPSEEWWTDASDTELAWVTERCGQLAAGTWVNNRSTIYEAELEAMVVALAKATGPVVINCDNQASVSALVKGHSKTATGNEMLRWLSENLRTDTVYVRWVPSQCNRSDPLTRNLRSVPCHPSPCTHRGPPQHIRWRHC